jgi:hypothetical protein
MLLRTDKSTGAELAALRSRLDEFYATATIYSAFNPDHETDDDQSPFHDLMIPAIGEMVRGGGSKSSK